MDVTWLLDSMNSGSDNLLKPVKISAWMRRDSQGQPLPEALLAVDRGWENDSHFSLDI